MAVSVGVAGGVPLQQRAVPRAALLHSADAAVCDPASACSPLQASRACAVVTAPIALKRGLRVSAVAMTERRAPNCPAQRRLGLCVLGRGSEAGVRTPPQRTRPIWLWRVAPIALGVEDPFMRTGCFPARGADRAAATGPGSSPREHGVRARRVAPGSECWLGQIDRATRASGEGPREAGFVRTDRSRRRHRAHSPEGDLPVNDSAAKRPSEAAGRRCGRSGWRRSRRSCRRISAGRCCA